MTIEPGDARAALLGRWLELTRSVLPGMAPVQRWPIRHDHCFMRVCLDAVAGAPWPTVIRRPAVRHMTVAQLRAAVRVAEAIVERPETLPSLNLQSLRGRHAAGPR